MSVPSALDRALVAGGRRGSKVAEIIRQLVVKGGDLGELEQYEFRDPVSCETKTGRRPQQQWFDRLTKAIETGAIDALSVDRVVEILLQGKN
jgi:hypothetical protein